jgi:predicted acetyltransferase
MHEALIKPHDGAPMEPAKSITPSDLELRRPRLDEEQEVLRAHRATIPEALHFLHYYEEGMPFARYLEVLQEQEKGINLRENFVPSSFLFAFLQDRIVGRASIRHRLSEHWGHVNGHIGYFVLPEFRRRGCATAILRLALRLAREKLGLPRVLVTCDQDNIGSIKTIEKCGGILENVVTLPDLRAPKHRYWIDTEG